MSQAIFRAASAACFWASFCACALATPIFVTRDGAGAGTGADWGNAKAFTNAWATLVEGDELWLKAETYALPAAMATDKAVALRGGFAGTESTAAERTGDARTTFDGGGTIPTTAAGATALLSFTAASGTVTLDRIEVKRSFMRGVEKIGGADMTLDGCRIFDNGYYSVLAPLLGQGAYLTGAAANSRLCITNCLFDRNVVGRSNNDIGNCNRSGTGAYVQDFAAFELVDTVFLTNGLRYGTCSGRDNTHGGALFVSEAPLAATRCTFRGNGVVNHNGIEDGGIVYLKGSRGAAFTNCAFVGNFGTYYYYTAFGSGGTIMVDFSSPTVPCILERCTVAYNFNRGAWGSAGVYVRKGAFTARNSILWGNLFDCYKGAEGGGDLFAASGSATLDTCLVGAPERAHCNYSGNAGTKPVFTGGMVYGNPLFASPAADFIACLSDASATIPLYVHNTKESYTKANKGLETLDVHLCSTVGRLGAYGAWTTDSEMSPAIDAAAWDVPVGAETAPNGVRANLGVYGCSAEASRSLSGAPTIENTAVDSSSTEPDFTFSLGGEGMYKATVFLCHGATAGQTDSTNGWTHVHCLTETGANGDSFSPSAKWQYAPGSDFAWRVVVVAADKTANAGGAATISTGAVYPAWWTAGGGSGVIHVWLAAEAYGSAKTGESWRHAVATLSEALALVTDGKTEIWIADDLLLDGNAATASPFALTVRGGFTGAENAASARSAGTVSRLDANETYADILRLAHTSGKAVLERLAFLNSREHGLYKTGAGSLELRDCRFERNGRCPEVCTLTGRGAYLTGGAGATLLITNCVFNDNRILMGAAACGVGGDTPYQSGCGAYVTTFQRFDLVDTLFSSNGCPLTAAPGRGGTHGFALAIDSAPVHALRCDFIANVGSHYEASAGAIVCVYGASDGSSFTNCLWTGNFHNPYSRNGTRGGALEINMSSAAYTCSLGNCTIAYNLVDAITCAAGLQVTKGTIDIGDSIIYGNSISATYNSAGADVYVANVDSSVTLRHSLLASSLGTYASSASGTGVILGDGMIYGDPLFATPTADYIANISSTAPGYPDAQAPLTFADWAANGAFDLHLCSVQGRWNGTDHSTQDETTSPAIDRAAATTPVGDEPAPNGNRRNLGRYGGTAEASLTPSGGVPAIDAVSVNPAYDYTQPAITVTVGGTGAYAATVTFCFGTILPGGAGTNGWQAVRVQEPVGNGDVVVMPSQTYYPHGATVYWRVIVTAEGAEPIVRNGSYEVTDEAPVFLGRGGGANVIHLRPAAKGTGTGDNWADAVTTFDEARDLITETRNQIWFAGDVARDEAPTVQQILKSVTILGGFAGSEDAATDRVAGARTTIDGAKLYNCLAFGVAPDVTLEIEDFVFTRSLKSAFTKTGAGSLTVRNCRFTDNGWFSTTVGSDVSANRFQGGGASVTSGRCVFYNCLFDGNLDRRAMIYGTDGHGLYASGASLALYDCSFVTNGLAESITSTAETGSPCREGFVGTAVYALRCRDVTAAGCRFIGQRMTEHSGGSVFCIAGASVASQNPSVSHSHQFVISNCLFAANSSVQWISSSYPCNSAPLAFLGSDYDACPGTAIVERCTFAYNSYASGQDAAALLVTQGKSTSTWFVRVRNSIFSGNLGSTFVASAPTAADIRLNGYVEFDMDYSLIAGVNPPYVINSSSRSVTFGDHFVLAPDALFVTPQETFLGALTASGVQLPTHASRVIRAKQTDPTAWNFHLRGSTGYDDETTGARLVFRGRSPAIDAGDPAADYTSEPPPNGRRLNLGFYGGTPWATRTAFGGMCIIIR